MVLSFHIINSQVFPPSVDHIPVLFQFISWLNLNLGIDTCFYNGMDKVLRYNGVSHNIFSA